MYRGNTKALAVAIVFFAMMALAVASPALSDDASADVGETQLVVIYNDDQTVGVHAGSDMDFKINVYSNYANSRILYVYSSCSNPEVDVSTDVSPIEIKPGAYQPINIHVDADKYAHQGEYAINLTFDVRDENNASEEGTYQFRLVLKSDLSSENQYNKFMGVWNNNMPAPLNSAWFAALVTGLVWFAIGFVARLIAVPVVMRIIMKKDDPDYQPIRRLLAKMCMIIILLNAVGKSIRVLELDEHFIDAVNILFYFCYIVVGAFIVWRIYVLIINLVIKRLESKNVVLGGSRSDFESLKPLFLYVGEILLAIVSVGLIMNLLGFDMTAIITSAGIVSLGITLGAQNVLGQFFSGLVLLSTRPFKKGDYITLDGGTITYKVRKVNIMQTELENWDNTDITLVPNSTITSGVVKNITRDTLKCKIHVFVSVGYGNDLALVRTTMLEVANENARVIKDGSLSKPVTRVIDFQDSNIQLRLSVFVDDFNDSGSIGGELRYAMYYKFLQKGITIDYPNIVVRPAAVDSD